MSEIPEDRRAPDGCIWVCCACGKTAEDLYGIIGEKSYGWDESCSLNAQAFDRNRLVYRGKLVVEVKDADEKS